MNDDSIRISDADRERAAAQLRDHYAEGRLTSDELDHRLAEVLSATTFGGLRTIMADLPGPVPSAARWRAPGAPGAPGEPGPGPYGPQQAWHGPPWARRRGGRPAFRRRPRIWPLALVLLIMAVVIPGAFGLAFKVVLLTVLVTWLVACVAGLFAVLRFRRHARRFWTSGPGAAWRAGESRFGDWRFGDWRDWRGWPPRPGQQPDE